MKLNHRKHLKHDADLIVNQILSITGACWLL